MEMAIIPIQQLTGHTDWVWALAVSPDGRWLVSGSRDKTVRVWNNATGKIVHTLEGHTDTVKSVIVTPDNQHIISGSEDGTVKVWDITTGNLQRTIKKHSEGVNAVAVFPDGEWFASGSKDETVRIWNLKTGKLQRTFQGYTNALVVSPDGRWLVSGGGLGGMIRVWELATGKLMHTLSGSPISVGSLAVSPDSKLLLSDSYPNLILVWELATGKLLNTITGHRNSITEIIVTMDNQHVVSGSLGGNVRVWNLVTGELRRTLSGHAEGVFAATVSPDNQTIFVGDKKNIWIWRIEAGELKHTLKSHNDSVSSVALSTDGRWLVSGSADKAIRIWDFTTGELQRTFEGHQGGVTTVALSPNGQWIVSGSHDNTIKLWDFNTGEICFTLTDYADEELKEFTSVTSVAINSRYIVSGSNDERIRIWDLQTGKLLRTLDGYGIWADIVFSPDGKYVISKGTGSRVCVWDVETGKLCHTIEGFVGSVSSVAVSPNGEYVVLGLRSDVTRDAISVRYDALPEASSEDLVWVWKMSTGELSHTLHGHTGGVSSVAISYDGCFIISGSYDKTIRIWNLKTGALLRVLKGHTNAVNSVVISPDSRYIASGSQDATVRIWHFREWLADLYLFSRLPEDLQSQLILNQDGLIELTHELHQKGRIVLEQLYTKIADSRSPLNAFLPGVLPYLPAERQHDYMSTIRTCFRQELLQLMTYNKQIGQVIPPWKLRLRFSATNPVEFPEEQDIIEIPLTEAFEDTKKDSISEKDETELRLPDRKETALHFRLDLDGLPPELGPWIEAVVLTMVSDRGDLADLRFTNFTWDKERKVYYDWSSFKLDAGYKLEPEAFIDIINYRLELCHDMQPQQLNPLERTLINTIAQMEQQLHQGITEIKHLLVPAIDDSKRATKRKIKTTKAPQDSKPTVKQKTAQDLEAEPVEIDRSLQAALTPTALIRLHEIEDPPEWHEVYEAFEAAFIQPNFSRVQLKIGGRGSGLARFVESVEAKIIAISFLPAIASFIANWILSPLYGPIIANSVQIGTYLFVAFIGLFVIFQYLYDAWRIHSRVKRRRHRYKSKDR